MMNNLYTGVFVSVLLLLSLVTFGCSLPQVSPIPLNVICPDEKSECPTDQTCCQSPEGSYVCCPAPKAVCCDDGKHCCYEGQTCNSATETCDNSTKSFISLREMKRRPEVICPDYKTTCDSGETCCSNLDNSWGCCPLIDAVCCMDGKHCCPAGTKCDITRGICIQIVPPLQLISTTNSRWPPSHHGHQCQPGYCSSDQTCCVPYNGNSFCCPTPNGVCCHGSLYCCPEGSECNEVDGKCDKVWNTASTIFKGSKENQKMILLKKK